MSETDWNPLKMTTFGLLLVGATALVMTLVMGYRADREDDKQTGATSRANAPVRKTLVPSQIEDVEACQAYAQQRTGDKTMDKVKDDAIGGVVGAGTGAAGGAIADGGSGAGKGAVRYDAQYQAAYRSCMRQKGY
jgi:hypothetical protein